jgi:superkiller protein 3
VDYDVEKMNMKKNAIYKLFLAGEYVKAEKLYRKCLARDDSDPDVHIMLGSCLSYQDKYDEAIPFLKSGIELSTSDNELAHAWFKLGIAYDKLEDHVKTEEACRESLARSPLEPYTYILLAISLEKQDRERDAIPCYQKAINVSTEDVERGLAYEGLADIYFYAGEWEEAIENYETAMRLSIELNVPENFCNLGCAYEELHDYARAEVAYRKSLILDPSNPDVNIKLGALLFNQGMTSGLQNKYEEAILFLKSGNKFTTDEEQRARICLILGSAYIQLKDFANAASAFQDCLSIDPTDELSSTMLGNCLVQQEKYNEGISFYQKSLDLATDDSVRAEIYEKLGTAYGKSGDHERAEATYRESLALDPSYAPAYFNLGMTLVFQDKSDEAVPYYKKVLEFGNDKERSLAFEKLEEIYAAQKKTGNKR